MIVKNYFNQAKSILCLNGDLPEKDFFDINKKIIAADGATNTLIKMGLEPDYVIGDLDSLTPNLISKNKIIYTPDQNKTDFEKSLEVLKSKDLLPSIVCGVNGGALDHIFFNLNVIIQNDCFFYSPPYVGIVISSSANLNLQIGTRISIFGFNAKVNSTGLKWELDKTKLNFPGFNSLSNVIISSNVEITVLSGKILIIFSDIY